MTYGSLVAAIISLTGVVISVATSAFIAGTKSGTIQTTMTTISERLARIEGMFELKLKDPKL